MKAIHLATEEFLFGTKAETLYRLNGLVTSAIVPDGYYCTVEHWKANKVEVVKTIRLEFQDQLLAVRSSAMVEDGAKSSMAGEFLSTLNVDGSNNNNQLVVAIDAVASSMTLNPRDQILVQPMVKNIAVGGVIMTYDLVNGAPYYCIDFDDESGRTDLVTSGNGLHKSLFVYRDCIDKHIKSKRIFAFLRLAKELESICRCDALDIEFGMDKAGVLYLLQVRRIALAQSWHPVTERRIRRQLAHVESFVQSYTGRRDRILGRRAILAIMPDWNPAEIIGTSPRPLASSLYQYLITRSTWSQARALMGYRHLSHVELMVLVNNHPYIDVRNSFNSFLPSTVCDTLGEKLVNAWLDRFQEWPEYHDKIEFEIVSTCVDFTFDEDFQTRFPELLSSAEFSIYRQSLLDLTRRCLAAGTEGMLEQALAMSKVLENAQPRTRQGQDAYAILDQADLLLCQCLESGTLPFAMVARHAFIAESLLRSACRRGAISAERLALFRRSIRTVSGDMLEAYGRVCSGEVSKSEFYMQYGHLRPGTYEITSLRYDQRDDLFLGAMPLPSVPIENSFQLAKDERQKLDELLAESELDVIGAEQLMDYARKAISGREHVKFVFTKALSDALLAISKWGGLHGLSVDDLSYIEWNDIQKCLTKPVMDDVDRHFLEIVEKNRKSMTDARIFKLGHIVFGVSDIYVATLNRSVPNFVGQGSVSGLIIQLEANTPTTVNIHNRIVCIENADPGFDWIFTRGPAALITRFGGANSHMAVRSAEFGLAAAIGCGDQIYHQVVQSESVELNCTEKIVRPVYVG